MPKRQYTGVYEMEVTARKLRNGNRVRLTLEAPWDKVQAKGLQDLQFAKVNATFELSEDQGDLFDEDEPEPETPKTE